MKRKWMMIVVAVTVLAVAALAFGQVRRAARSMGHGDGFGLLGERALAQAEVRLKLTPEQSTQIREILNNAREQTKQQRGAGAEDHQALAKAIFADRPNQGEIQNRMNAIQQRQQERLQAMVNIGMQINQVLTPVQRAELQKMIEERAQVHERMRQRMEERRQQRSPER